jgi:hypothetical protein
MRILILGAGKMGSFFTDLLSFDHEVAVYEIDARKLRFMYNAQRFTNLDEIKSFSPDLVINAVSLKYTLSVFDEVAPYLPHDCILSDISSVKTGFKEYYERCGFRYVSSHPMFGPTFANLGKLQNENAIVITEGDYMGEQPEWQPETIRFETSGKYERCGENRSDAQNACGFGGEKCGKLNLFCHTQIVQRSAKTGRSGIASMLTGAVSIGRTAKKMLISGTAL